MTAELQLSHLKYTGVFKYSWVRSCSLGLLCCELCCSHSWLTLLLASVRGGEQRWGCSDAYMAGEIPALCLFLL